MVVGAELGVDQEGTGDDQGAPLQGEERGLDEFAVIGSGGEENGQEVGAARVKEVVLQHVVQ
jgi:hypothetical protein